MPWTGSGSRSSELKVGGDCQPFADIVQSEDGRPHRPGVMLLAISVFESCFLWIFMLPLDSDPPSGVTRSPSIHSLYTSSLHGSPLSST